MEDASAALDVSIDSRTPADDESATGCLNNDCSDAGTRKDSGGVDDMHAEEEAFPDNSEHSMVPRVRQLPLKLACSGVPWTDPVRGTPRTTR